MPCARSDTRGPRGSLTETPFSWGEGAKTLGWGILDWRVNAPQQDALDWCIRGARTWRGELQNDGKANPKWGGLIVPEWKKGRYQSWGGGRESVNWKGISICRGALLWQWNGGPWIWDWDIRIWRRSSGSWGMKRESQKLVTGNVCSWEWEASELHSRPESVKGGSSL